MKNYKDYTDEQIVLKIHDDNESGAIDYIMNKYKDLVRKKAGSMYILGADRDDLIQEGMIGLFKAVRDYDIGRDASFMTFADLCISRQMYSAIASSARKKHAPLNSYISIYSNREDEGNSGSAIESILESDSSSIPEEHIIEQENIKDIEKAILASDLGLTPTNDGKVIRLVFPELTEERRKELVKDVKKKGENAKVAIRNIRRDANEAFKKQSKANEISEDDLSNLEDDIQKLTDKYIEEINKLYDAKEKEILA